MNTAKKFIIVTIFSGVVIGAVFAKDILFMNFNARQADVSLPTVIWYMNVAQPLFNPPNTSNWQPNDRLLVHFDLDGSILGFLFRLDNMVCTPLDGGGKHCQFGVNGTPVVIPIPVVIQSPRTNQTDDFYPIQVQGATYGPIVQASPDVLSTAAYNSDRGDPVGKIGIVFVGPMVVVTSPLPTSSGCGGAGHPCQAPK